MMIKKLICFMFGHKQTVNIVFTPCVTATPVKRVMMMYYCVRCGNVHQETIYDKDDYINNHMGA